MTRQEAIKMLKKEKEIQALDMASFVLFTTLGLELLYRGVYPIAKILRPPAVKP